MPPRDSDNAPELDTKEVAAIAWTPIAIAWTRSAWSKYQSNYDSSLRDAKSELWGL